ncbi:MAG: rod shape-determining protein MreB [Clostridia bacterium]|jgi:rod shape-determining protein MreB|nr:rod shape-determining protein MreB [Clostridia bacterium]
MVFGEDIGIDLGTASVLVYVKNKGIVLNESSVVAIEKQTGQLIAVGEEARQMLGRTPGSIVAIRPMREGVIADYEVTERMLKYFISKVIGSKALFKPRVMIGIPSGVTGVEQRAVKQAAIAAGAKQAFLIEEPLAAALGAGLEISEPRGSMVVDIGGGTTDIAVLSLGSIVTSKSIRIGGDNFDASLIRYMRRYHNLLIGERTAEQMKKDIGTAYPQKREHLTAEIRGRDLVSGLPRTITVTAREAFEAIKEAVESILSATKEVLEKTPPELSSDIMDKGIVLTGGGALLHGLDKYLSEHTHLPIYIAENPIQCVAMGTAKALINLDVLAKAHSAKNVR